MVLMEGYFSYLGNMTANLSGGREHFVISSVVKIQTMVEIYPAVKEA